MNIVGDEVLLKTLHKEFLKGVPFLQEFIQKGIPGRKKSFRDINSEEDLITILKHFQEMYPQFFIVIDQTERRESQKRYTILKWNGQYGDEAKFIVRDNWTSKQSLFIPGRCQDLFWFSSDLANDKTTIHWKDFDEESFDDLEPIAF